VIVAWIMGIRMDLDFNLLETGCLGFAIIVTAFTLQVCTMPLYMPIFLLFSFILFSYLLLFINFVILMNLL
jgi:Ca2+:H+ antiporter